MNLNKVLELNEESEKSLRSHKFIDHANAILIGNEAIKCVINNRLFGIPNSVNPLPGETKDQERGYKMNLEKAIEIKQHYQYLLRDASLPELIEADNISIEALKFCQKFKEMRRLSFQPTLPGETEDQSYERYNPIYISLARH